MEYKFTFKNGDYLQLKSFKHSEFASEETHCYEATVYFNRNKIGTVLNRGNGGADDFHADKPFAENNKIWRYLVLVLQRL